MRKILKKELKINWSEPNYIIHNKVRAFCPFPSMYTFLGSKRIKILKTTISDYVDDSSKIGEIIIFENKLIVKCGVGFIEISMLQPDSKKEMKSIDFINGFAKLLNQPFNVLK